MRIRVDIERPAPRQLAPAAEAARKGGVILYPSDTGYAFGCALSSTKGIAASLKDHGASDGNPAPSNRFNTKPNIEIVILVS